jgi:predicted ATPase/class 3 adenylate cyclase
MPQLLTGTVTFLFTDIEGSTRLVRSQGERWTGMLERHRTVLRAAFDEHDGREVGTEGDSFFVAFSSAPAAVAAAVRGQRVLAAEPWPPDAEVRVRMGMHTGEATLSAKTYAGLHVHRASRVASVAHGGQVLISDATRTLVEHDLPGGVELRDLGEHRLKDLERPERLWQLVISGLRNDFPLISSLDATPNNLPTRLTTFLGREREITEVGALLAENRLLTLTGPGGTGKTRLSLEVAGRALRHYPDGVHFVELAAITDPDLVMPTVAQALNLPDRGGGTPTERLVDHLGELKVLLVLDNFEQVLDAAGAVGHLLSTCPHLSVIVSSRSALHVSGEQEYPVPPLAVPDPAHLPSLAQLSQYESVALFIERARSVRPDFEVTNVNAPAVAEICVRLDGLPLAIELAAARIRILTPQAMLARLNDRLGLLAGGSRDLPERQQTLRGAIAWSHDMLDEEDRALFAALSVFVGGASLDLVERVCADDLSGDALDALASLVEKSLVRQQEGVGGEPRFEMLETIREFAAEQAIARGRRDDLRSAHAAAYADLADSAAAEIMGPRKRQWLDRLEEEHDNLRAAIGWALESKEAEIALRLTSRLWRFWQMRGYLTEGLQRVEEALSAGGASDYPVLMADALSAAAGIAYWLGDTERSRVFYEREVETRGAIDDRPGLAEALYGLSFAWQVELPLSEKATQAATEAVHRAIEIYTELGDEPGIGRCEWGLGNLAYAMDDVAAAREHAGHALDVFRRIGDDFMVGWATFTLATTALAEEKAVDGGSATLRSEARDALREALRIFAAAQDVSGYALVLDGLSLVAFRDGDLPRAARLAGAVRRLERVTGTGLNIWNRGILEFDPDTAFAEPTLAAAYAAGEHMTDDEAVAYALQAAED